MLIGRNTVPRARGSHGRGLAALPPCGESAGPFRSPAVYGWDRHRPIRKRPARAQHGGSQANYDHLAPTGFPGVNAWAIEKRFLHLCGPLLSAGSLARDSRRNRPPFLEIRLSLPHNNDLSGEKSEGDTNFSPLRQAWQDQSLDPASAQLLAEDARWFLQQSLSTPCLNALRSCGGIWLEDTAGRATWTFTATTSTRSALPIRRSSPPLNRSSTSSLSARAATPTRWPSTWPASWPRSRRANYQKSCSAPAAPAPSAWP